MTIALFASNTPAQTTTGTFLGYVTDMSGQVLRGARVTATNEATGLTRAVTTGGTGEYLIALLPVGRYTLTFEAGNFKQLSRKGVKLEIDQRARIKAVMEAGSVTEVITVDDADSTLARTETAEAGEVIENKRIVDLPLNGRLFLQLAQLTPGVVETPRGSFAQQLASISGPRLTVTGARESDNYFTLDGVSVTDRFFNTLSAPLSVEGIQEFKVRSNLYTAETGTLGGAQINIAIKSGTNDLHGTAFGFLRNDAFDARNYFDFMGKPEFRQNNFGGALGGPVIKNKAFFFANYEGLRLARAQTRLFTVPTSDLRAGQFSTTITDPMTNTPFPGNKIPDARISSTSQALLQHLPLQNLPGTINNFVDSPQEINDNNQFTIKADYRIGSSDTAFVRYTFYDVNAYQPYGFIAFASSPPSVPGFGLFLDQRSQNVAISETHSFNPRLIGEFKFGFNRTAGGQVQENSNIPFVAQHNIEGASTSAIDQGIPRITIAGFNALGDIAMPISRHDNDYQANYNLSWFRSGHNFIFGGMYKRLQYNPFIVSNKRGLFTYNDNFTGNAFADFLLGMPSVANGGFGDVGIYLRGNEWHGFVQDNWKATKRLTVNLGLRYEYASPFTERNNRWSTLDIRNRRLIVASEDGQTYPQELWIPGIQQAVGLPIVSSEEAGLDRSLVNKDLNNFAPRIGLAFDVFGNQKTVVRTGYGIYYNAASFNTLALQGQLPPFFKMSMATNSAELGLTTNNILADPLQGLPAFRSYDINFRSPYFQQWNLGIQQLLTRDLLVEAQYLGSKGTKLYTNIWYNTPDASPVRNPSPFPTLANFALQASAANSNYHALVLKAEKRLSQGLMVFGSYTFSKSIDNDSLGNTTIASGLDQSNIKALERGLSTFDARHRVVVSTTYDLPFKAKNKYLFGVLGNWQMGGIINHQSGNPFTVNLANIDRSNNGLGLIGSARPNLVADPNLPADQRTTARWFNTDAFALQPFGFLGTAGRNVIEGPGYNSVDLSLLKNIPITERHKLQFRAEFFNAFNHVNFDIPERMCTLANSAPAGASCTVSNSPFGTVSAARDPRILQFALKYTF
jgi:hypothetical protein